MSDSNPGQRPYRQRIYTDLSEYDIRIQSQIPNHQLRDIKSRKHSKQAVQKKSCSKAKARKIPQFRVKKYNNKLLDKLVSLLAYTIQSADKAMQYIPLSMYFDANFQTRLYYSDRQNLINWLNSLTSDDLQALNSFANLIQNNHSHTAHQLNFNIADNLKKKSVRSKSHSNINYQISQQPNQQYKCFQYQPENVIQCSSCHSLNNNNQKLSHKNIVTQNHQNQSYSVHHYIDQSTAQQIRSDIDRLKSDIEELRKMKKRAQDSGSVFFQQKISIVQEVYQKCHDRMHSHDNSDQSFEKNHRFEKSSKHKQPQKDMKYPEHERKSHRIKIPQQQLNTLKRIQKEYKQIESLIQHKLTNIQSRTRPCQNTQSKQKHRDRSFHYNPLARKSSLFEEVDNLVSQLEREAGCFAKDYQDFHLKRENNACQSESSRQIQFEISDLKRKNDELKKTNDHLKMDNEDLKKANDNFKKKLQKNQSVSPHNQPHDESHSFYRNTNRITINQPQPHQVQSSTMANNKISRLQTQLSVCKNNFKAFFNIVKSILLRYPPINGKKLDDKLVNQLKNVQAKDGKVEKGMEILIKLLDSVVAENTKLRIDAQTRQDACNKSFTYIETRIQKSINNQILDELERSRHSIEQSIQQKQPHTTKSITTANSNHFQQLQTLRVQLYSKDQTILKLSQLLQTKQLQLSKLKIHVQRHEEQKHETNQILTNQHLALEEIKYLLEERQFQLGKCKQQLQRKDQDLKELEKYLNKVQNHAVSLREQNSKFKDNIDQFNSQLQAMKQEKVSLLDYAQQLERKEKQYQKLINDKENETLELKNILREYENGYRELEERYYDEIKNKSQYMGQVNNAHRQTNEKDLVQRIKTDINSKNTHKKISNHKSTNNRHILISDSSPKKLFYQIPTSNNRSYNTHSHDQQQDGKILNLDMSSLLQEKDQIIEQLKQENEKLNLKLQNNLQLMLTFRNQCNDLQAQINLLNEINSQNQRKKNPAIQVGNSIEEKSQREEDSSKKTVLNQFTIRKDHISIFERTQPFNRTNSQDKHQKAKNSAQQSQQNFTQIDKLQDQNKKLKTQNSQLHQKAYQLQINLSQLKEQKEQLQKTVHKLKYFLKQSHKKNDLIQQNTYDNSTQIPIDHPSYQPQVNSETFYRYHNMINEQKKRIQSCDHNLNQQNKSETFYRYHNLITNQNKIMESCDHSLDQLSNEQKQRFEGKDKNTNQNQKAFLNDSKQDELSVPTIQIQTAHQTSATQLNISDETSEQIPDKQEKKPSNKIDSIRNSLISIDIGSIGNKKRNNTSKNKPSPRDQSVNQQEPVEVRKDEVRIQETNISQNQLVNKIEWLQKRIDQLQYLLQNCVCQQSRTQIPGQDNINKNKSSDKSSKQVQSNAKKLVPLIKIQQNQSEPSISNKNNQTDRQHPSSPSSIHSNPTYAQKFNDQAYFDPQSHYTHHPIYHPQQALSNDQSFEKNHPDNTSFNYSPNHRQDVNKRKNSVDSNNDISQEGRGNNTSHKQGPSNLLNQLELQGFKQNQQTINMSNHVSSRGGNTERSRQPMTDRSIATISQKQLTDRNSNQEIQSELNQSKQLDKSKQLDPSKQLYPSNQTSNLKQLQVSNQLSKSRQSVGSNSRLSKQEENELLKRNRGDRRPSFLVYRPNNSIFSDIGLDTQPTYRRRINADTPSQAQITNTNQQNLNSRGSSADPANKNNPSLKQGQSTINQRLTLINNYNHESQPKQIQELSENLQNIHSQTPRQTRPRKDSNTSRIEVDLNYDYQSDPSLQTYINNINKKRPLSRPSDSSYLNQQINSNKVPVNSSNVRFNMNTIRENSQNSQTNSKVSNPKQRQYQSFIHSQINNYNQKSNKQKVISLHKNQDKSFEFIQNFLNPNSTDQQSDPWQVQDKEKLFFEMALYSRDSSEKIVKELMHIVKSLRGQMQLLTVQYESLNRQYIELSRLHHLSHLDHSIQGGQNNQTKIPDHSFEKPHLTFQRSQTMGKVRLISEGSDKKDNSIPQTVIQSTGPATNRSNVRFDMNAIKQNSQSCQTTRFDYKEAFTKAKTKLSVDEVINLRQQGIRIIDVRGVGELNEGIIKGAICIDFDGGFTTWVVALIDPKDQVILYGEENTVIEAAKIMLKKGYKNICGYANFAMDQWKAKGECFFYPEWVESIFNSGRTVLDVRKPQQWKNGIADTPDTVTLELTELFTNVQKLDKSKKYVAHCKSGYRARIAYSLLKSLDFDVQACLIDVDILFKLKQKQSIKEQSNNHSSLKRAEEKLFFEMALDSRDSSEKIVKELMHIVKSLRGQMQLLTVQYESLNRQYIELSRLHHLSHLDHSIQGGQNNQTKILEQNSRQLQELQSKVKDLQNHKQILEADVKQKSQHILQLENNFNSYSFELPNLQQQVKLLEERVNFVEKEKHQLAKQLKKTSSNRQKDKISQQTRYLINPYPANGISLLFLANDYNKQQQSDKNNKQKVHVKQSQRDNDNEWQKEQLQLIKKKLNQKHIELIHQTSNPPHTYQQPIKQLNNHGSTEGRDNDTKQRLELIQNKHYQLQNEHNSLLNKYQSLQDQHQLLQGKQTEIEQINNKLINSIEQLNRAHQEILLKDQIKLKQIQELRRVNQDIKRQLDDVQDKYNKQSVQYNHLLGQYHTQLEQLNQLSENVKQSQDQINQLQAKYNQSKGKLQQQKSQNHSSQQTLNQKIQQNQRLHSELIQLQQFKQNHAIANNELEKLNNDIQNLKNQKNKLASENHRLSHDNNKIKEDNQHLTDENHRLQVVIQDKDEQIKQQKHQFIQLLNQIDSFNAQISTHQKQSASKNQQIQTHTKDLHQTKHLLNNSKLHSSSLQLQNHQLNQQLNQLKQQFNQQHNQINQLSQQLSMIESQKQQLQRYLSQAQEQLTQLQQKLTQLKSFKQNSSQEDSKLMEQLKNKIISLMNIISDKQSMFKQNELNYTQSINQLNTSIEQKDKLIDQLNQQILTLKSSIKTIQDSINTNPTGNIINEKSNPNDKRLVRSQKILNRANSTSLRFNQSYPTYPLEHMISKHKEQILALHKLLRDKDVQLKTLKRQLDTPSHQLPSTFTSNNTNIVSGASQNKSNQYKYQPNKTTHQPQPKITKQQSLNLNSSQQQLSDVSSVNITNHSSDLNHLRQQLHEVRNILSNRQTTYNQLLKEKDDEIDIKINIIKQKDSELDKKLNIIKDKDQEINQKVNLITQKDHQIKKIHEQLKRKTIQINNFQSRCTFLQKQSNSSTLKQTQRKLNTFERTNQTLKDEISSKNTQIDSLKQKIQRNAIQLTQERKTLSEARQQNLDHNKTIERLKNYIKNLKDTLKNNKNCTVSQNDNLNNSISPIRSRNNSPIQYQHQSQQQPHQRRSFTYHSNNQVSTNGQNNEKSPSNRSHSQQNKSEQRTNIATENNILSQCANSCVNLANGANSGINLNSKNELFEIHNFVKVYVKNPQNSSFIVTQNHLPEQQYQFQLSHYEHIHGLQVQKQGQKTEQENQNNRPSQKNSQRVPQVKETSLQISGFTDRKSFKSDRSLKQQQAKQIQTSRATFSQQGKQCSPPKYKRQQSPPEGSKPQNQQICYSLKRVDKKEQNTERVKSVDSQNSKSGELNRFYLENIVPQFFGKKRNTQSQQKEKK